MKFRRSIKNEKHDSAKPVPLNIAPKDAIAIEPPKKVIKAIYDYQATGDPAIYLSFSAGDFLHVVGRENDSDWYEACNPLIGSRGLVPVKYFEGVGKTVRDSGDSSASASATHDSGYSEGVTPRSTGPSRSSTMVSATTDMAPPMPGHRSSKSVAKALGGVYGVVAYDFKAERPDELDAKEGEAIIVIAQSNPEWFVAKPITRLGGPGLIPVSFIEIRDMTTGKPVDDPVAAVAKAGIPRVEEWKRMAAEYKNTSIPLGTVTSASAAHPLAHGMSRMSLNNGQAAAHAQHGLAHQRQQSNFNSYQQQQQQNLFAPMRASVPKYIFADEKFHFVVECKLSNGTHWDLTRVYEDFYELQINLINAFPEEAGQVPGKQRILPYMPGPVKYVTDNISEGRRANLDLYLHQLLSLQPNVTCSSLVRKFFNPRGNDIEVDHHTTDLENHARAAAPEDRYSTASLGSYQTGPQSTHQSSSEPSSHYGHHPQASTSSISHARSQSDFPQPAHTSSMPPPLSRQTTQSSALSNGAPIKVKVWFDRDTCVVIRMPPRGQFGYDDLYRKIVERRQLEYKSEGAGDEPIEIEYREKDRSEYMALQGDEDLYCILNQTDKLTLAVRTARPSSEGYHH